MLIIYNLFTRLIKYLVIHYNNKINKINYTFLPLIDNLYEFNLFLDLLKNNVLFLLIILISLSFNTLFINN